MMNGTMSAQLERVMAGHPNKREVYRNSNPSWASTVLHDVGPRMEAGVDKRRLKKLADFIEGITLMAPFRRAQQDRNWAPAPTYMLKMVNGQHACTGYMLECGGDGIGCKYAVDGTLYQVLTGYGIICWGWGMSNGYRAVVENQYAHDLHQVLSAEPVTRGFVLGAPVSGIHPKHVAQALRYFINCHERKDVATEAWEHALKVIKPEEVEGLVNAAPKVEARPEPKAPAPKPMAATTGKEAYRAMMNREDFEGASEMAWKKVHDLEASLKLWKRMAASADAMID